MDKKAKVLKIFAIIWIGLALFPIVLDLPAYFKMLRGTSLFHLPDYLIYMKSWIWFLLWLFLLSPGIYALKWEARLFSERATPSKARELFRLIKLIGLCVAVLLLIAIRIYQPNNKGTDLENRDKSETSYDDLVSDQIVHIKEARSLGDKIFCTVDMVPSDTSSSQPCIGFSESTKVTVGEKITANDMEWNISDITAFQLGKDWNHEAVSIEKGTWVCMVKGVQTIPELGANSTLKLITRRCQPIMP